MKNFLRCQAAYDGRMPPGFYDPPDDPEREWSESIIAEYLGGYEWDFGNDFKKTVSETCRTCRRDHADGKVKVGDRYKEVVERYKTYKGEKKDGSPIFHSYLVRTNWIISSNEE